MQLEYQHRGQMDFTCQDLLTLSTSFDIDFSVLGRFVGWVGWDGLDRQPVDLLPAGLLTVVSNQPRKLVVTTFAKNPRDASF